jgi:3',5'-nucleoside bisphosphate phosphatase
VIDLHLHTTASDGALAPRDLVARAADAGLRTISVTDHDTTGGLAGARDAAEALGVTLIPGIEITAVEAGRDVHVLGYFFDPGSRAFSDFLREQRSDRLRRVREMCRRLSALGFAVSTENVVDPAAERTGRSVGRPAIADALVRAGHARDRDDAFNRLIGPDSAAYVPRNGVSVAGVIGIIQEAGGIASLAHPALAGIDDLIPTLAARGLTALEARHPDHPPAAEAHYRALASSLELAVSGGSDFHGDGTSNAAALGTVTLGSEDFIALAERARSRRQSVR